MSSVELKSIVKKYGAGNGSGLNRSIRLRPESSLVLAWAIRVWEDNYPSDGCRARVRPTSGTLSIGDVDMTGVPPHQRTVGLVFQNYALFPHMTVRKNVEFGLKMQKVLTSERGPRVQELLEMIELGGRLDGASARRAVRRSTTTRVAIARALVSRARCFVLLDEPFAGIG